MDRRQFIGLGAGFALMSLLGTELRAQQPAAAPAEPATPVNLGVIGLGAYGRALLEAAATLPGAPVKMICDNYAGAFSRAKASAPDAVTAEDYKKVLEASDVDAVIIATPTHLHKQIALDAVAAGKHVFLEGPMAHTIEDARAIALAGKDSKKVFQVDLDHRTDPMALQVIKFVEIGAFGQWQQLRSQYHKRTSWRRAASSEEREKALNWRLDRKVSLGLVGEIGMHDIDLFSWYLGKQPTAVTGFGSILAWPDGRDVADTVQCVVEYPDGVRFVYDASLGNSYEGDYAVFMGSQAAVMMRDGRAWMFKEADAQALGWEVYARKETVGSEMGIALVADATKQLELGKEPGAVKPVQLTEKDFLVNKVKAFLTAIRTGKPPAAGPLEGYRANVAAIKASEAVYGNTKVTIAPDLYQLA
jgi:predicted dehydrogenase